MFDHPRSLLDDIDQLADTQLFPSASDALSSSEVGQSVIMLALGRMPVLGTGLATDEKVSELRQQTARQLVARWFLADQATLYSSLGIAPDCSPEMLRENYRRLIGLVHPDTRPVGFPDDSASRVNMAYSVLADAERRASYDATMALFTQQIPSPLQQAAASVSVRARTSQPDGIFDRFRAAVPQVRFKNGLLAIAGLMLLPIGYSVYSVANRDVQPQIVEARAKVLGMTDFPSRPEPLNNTGTAAPSPYTAVSDNALVVANIAAGQNRVPASTNENVSSATTAPAPQLNLSTRLQNLIGGNLIVAAPSAEAPIRDQNSTVSLAPVRPSTESNTTVQPEPTGATRTASASTAATVSSAGTAERTATKPPISADPIGPVVTADRAVRTPASSQVPPVQSSGTSPLSSTESRVNPADADDVLVKLSGAYEAGSIAAFSKVFATSMAGRRQLLSDYERVFQQTRQRSIRFTQFKHKVSGEKLLTSGFAVVSTVDNDNQSSSQRIFLEIDIGRDSEGLKIERLHNYHLN